VELHTEEIAVGNGCGKRLAIVAASNGGAVNWRGKAMHEVEPWLLEAFEQRVVGYFSAVPAHVRQWQARLAAQALDVCWNHTKGRYWLSSTGFGGIAREYLHTQTNTQDWLR